MTFPVTEHTVKSARHTTGYLACGAEAAPLLIFVHGWPELSISWRHQLPVFAALGFRCIAPDMRGYGRSSVYTSYQDYALRPSVQDMIELLDPRQPLPRTLFQRREPVRALPAQRLRPRQHDPAGRPLSLSRNRIPRRPMGIPTLLRRKLRESPHGFRGQPARHRQRAVS